VPPAIRATITVGAIFETVPKILIVRRRLLDLLTLLSLLLFAVVAAAWLRS